MPGPYEVLEDLERAQVHAVGTIDAALNADKGIEGVRGGIPEGRELNWSWGIVR
jgi:hypothetical protein